MRLGLPVLAVLAGSALLVACGGGPARAGYRVELAPVVQVSQACAADAGPPGNAEAEAAAAAPGYVYAAWIGCRGIGFARSVNGGRSYLPAVRVPGSADASRAGSWDPAVAVAPDGTVYVAYMHDAGGFSYPVVAISRNHGASFSHVTADRPPHPGNWGDRVFIAAGGPGVVYLTWDYGPRASLVRTLCSAGGSCAYAAGDLNAVIQKSVDGGRTFGPIVPLGPHFPRNGGYSSPLVVRPGGTVDVLYVDHPASPGTDRLLPGHEVFARSAGGTTWSNRLLWPGKGTLSLPEWWIDGDIAADAGGTLYATWDTQGRADVGWLTWSADGGAHWSAPVRVTPDTNRKPHIVQVAGGAPGVAYVAWLTDARRGYVLWLRPYSVRRGWLASPIRVSARYGKSAVWPGDTFGIAVLPGHHADRIALTWGSAAGSSKVAQIWGTVVTIAPAPRA